MQIEFWVLMFILGAAFGSFLCCQAWRLHFFDSGKKKLGSRSVCMKCKKQLKWYDNIPIISWLVLGGKCRFCKKKIGVAEILSEVLMGVAFLSVAVRFDLVNATAWSWAELIIMLILMCVLGFLAIYDGKWGELPNFVLILAGVLALGIVGIRIGVNGFSWTMVANLAGALAILGGTYLLLYLFSHGQWVGNGDYILGAIIALAIGDAWLALWILCIANFVGTLIMYPIVRKKKDRKIFLGPFLVVGFVVVQFLADFLSGLILF